MKLVNGDAISVLTTPLPIVCVQANFLQVFNFLSLWPCSHLFRFAFRSRSGPVPLVRVAFTPAKIDRTRSGCGPVTRSHLFRNATGTRTVTHTPPQHIRFSILGLLSSRRVTALTASRHRRRRSLIDGQIRRCMMCRNFRLQRNFGRCIII